MKNKNRVLILVIFLCTATLMYQSCKKETKTTGSGSGSSPLGQPPNSFSQKVLIENFKGEWNPNCPSGDDSIKRLCNENPKVLGVSIHQGDWLTIPDLFNNLSTHFGGVSSYPRAAINRMPAIKGTQLDSTVYSIFNWRLNIDELLKNKQTNCGLAFTSNEVNAVLNLNVHIGFQGVFNERTRLSVYVIEDSVQAQNQVGAAADYKHPFVVRKMLSGYLGDSVNMTEGNYQYKKYTLNNSEINYKKSNVYFIAVLHTIGANFKTHKVLNVQKAKALELKKWD